MVRVPKLISHSHSRLVSHLRAQPGSRSASTNLSHRTERSSQRIGLTSPVNETIDGESLSGTTRYPPTDRRVSGEYRYAQSPGGGGFSSTPLFLNARPSHFVPRGRGNSLDPSVIEKLLPNSYDLVRLLLSISSHRTSQDGVFLSWMAGTSYGTPVGRLRLLTYLAYVLLDGGTSRPLTWSDVQGLQAAQAQLRDFGDPAEDLSYFVSIVLEDIVQKDLSLKFRLENVLDFNDQITIRGWADGGRDSIGSHSEELRVWFARTCREMGVVLSQPDANARHQCDLSPVHDTEANWGADDAAPGPRFSPTTLSDTDHHSRDPFSHLVVERVFGDLYRPLTDLPLDRRNGTVTPKPWGASNGEATLREIVVVDVQTDHSLRRHINKAMELRKQFPNEREFVTELIKFIQRRLHFETPETKGTIIKLAKSREGFMHIGEVRTGANSRHFAILFKTLCDATGVYCRLVRDSGDVYYNVVMISDSSPMEDSGNENRRESNLSSTRASDACDSDSGEDDEFDDAPEELVPIFWESTASLPQKRIRLTHPLDALLQRCNSASEAVDLDDFFTFQNLLGKGSFGEVWRVDLKIKPGRKKSSYQTTPESVLIPGSVSTGPFALKLIPPEEADKEEASFMRIYSHSRVINVIAVFRGYQVLENRKRELEKKPAMCILMEMADRCLETVLAGSTEQADDCSPRQPPIAFKRLDLRFVFRILTDSARAMSFLHSPVGQRPHLVHRDLKPGNILITSDSRAIVTDFGVARINPSLETNLTVGAGTEGYMAPEQKTLLYDRPADVYSFGVIIARILGIQRWKDASNLSVDDFDQVEADPVLSQVCLKCVQPSPLHRPSFEQIYQALLCEFVRRELSRTVTGALPLPMAPELVVSKANRRRMLRDHTGCTPDSSESELDAPLRRNPPRGRGNNQKKVVQRKAPKKGSTVR